MYKIGLSNLFNRLVARFKLMVIGDSVPYLSNQVMCITNVDELVKTVTIASTTKDISAADQVYFTVPIGKRWYLHQVYRGASTGSADLFIGTSAWSASEDNRVRLATGTGNSYVNSIEVTLRQGSVIGMTTSSNGADTAVRVGVIYSETDDF